MPGIKIYAYQRGRVTFLSPNKKVTKEIGIGEALNVALPRAKAALSYVPLPARTWRPCSTLTGKTGKTPRRNVGGGSALPALPRMENEFPQSFPSRQKVGTLFACRA